MAELWDVYDSTRRKTGKTMRRGEPSAPDEFHLIVHAWIRLKNGRFLITKRSPDKDIYPGLWETTGSVVSGEESVQSAIREIREETGLNIDSGDIALFRTLKGLNRFSNHFVDVFIARYERDVAEIDFQEEEVTEYRIADKKEISELLKNGRFVPDVSPYVDDLFEYCER